MTIIKMLMVINLIFFEFKAFSSAWNGKVIINDKEISYLAMESDNIDENIIQIMDESIKFVSLHKILSKTESVMQAQNCSRIFCSPCCCFIPLIGVCLTSSEKRKVSDVRALIQAAYKNDEKSLLKFKNKVVTYLDNIASGKMEPPILSEISAEESQRWRAMTAVEVGVYLKKINVAGSSIFKSDEYIGELDIDLASCCCVSISGSPFDLDTLIRKIVTTRGLVISDVNYSDNFEGKIQYNMDQLIKKMIENSVYRNKARKAARATKEKNKIGKDSVL